MYKKYIKRILDFTLSLIGLIIISPILILVSIFIKLDSKGSIFFLQERLGIGGTVFKIIKFRTMIINAENTGDGLKVRSENDNRITKVGKFLRKTSLDELPQLINVLKGDMSLVGPRPPVTYFPYKYEEYSEFQKQRFCVRPGITGLAQVTVRNSVKWDKRIELDIEYIKKITIIEDAKILFKTVIKVFKSERIYAELGNEENKEQLEKVQI